MTTLGLSSQARRYLIAIDEVDGIIAVVEIAIASPRKAIVRSVVAEHRHVVILAAKGKACTPVDLGLGVLGIVLHAEPGIRRSVVRVSRLLVGCTKEVAQVARMILVIGTPLDGPIRTGAERQSGTLLVDVAPQNEVGRSSEWRLLACKIGAEVVGIHHRRWTALRLDTFERPGIQAHRI
jgi:hypothetical protein